MPSAANAMMLTRLLALIAVVGLVLTACESESRPSSGRDKNTRQVTVVGEGQVQGTPDTLTVDASIEATAPDATTALNQTSERMQAVITALVDTAKIDRKDISTTNVSLRQQVGPDSSTVIGYRASNSIAVKIRKLDAASETLRLITDIGGDATRLDGINFTIDDDSQLVKDARTRAFDDARARAEQYAQLSGLELGKVISISETGAAAPPTPLDMPREAAAPVPLEPGQQTVSFSVTVVWELT